MIPRHHSRPAGEFWLRGLLLAVLALAWGCRAVEPEWRGDPLAEPQARSLFGEDLYARPDTGEVAGADAALAEAPDDVELLLVAARVRWDFWQYRQAIAIYTRVMELAPEDWRAHAYRGIRQASVREFDGAVRDLEAARVLAPLDYDVSYYLGFAYFLTGRYEEAANEYLRCFALADDPDARAALGEGLRSCAIIAADAEWKVAMTDWAIRALRRAGRHDEAMRFLDDIDPETPIESNNHYFDLLLYYKGLKSESELLSVGADGPYRFETVGYGVANWLLLEGETERAVEILEKCAADPWWPGYGRIAAEVDLVRLSEEGPS